MPLDDIISLCISVPLLISLIVLLYIFVIKSINVENKFRESTNKLNEIKIKYYEWLLSHSNYNHYDDEERED